MSAIYIASKDAALVGGITGKDHLYLVYDPDSDPTNGNEEIIRGGPEGFFDQIQIEAGFDISASEDTFEIGDTPASRNYTLLDLSGLSASTVWAAMTTAAESMGTYDAGDGLYHTGIDYSPIGFNSNSVVVTVLAKVGIDIIDQRPLTGGSGDPISLSTFPGANGLLGSSADETWNITLFYPKVITDQGGDDTYIIDMDAISEPLGALTILEVPETGTTDIFIVENTSVGNVGVFRSVDGNGLIITAEGRVIGFIPNQYKDGTPLLSTVRVAPSGGSPTDIPVDNPDWIPLFSPEAVPGWVPSVADPFHTAETSISPIVFDLDMSGTIELAALNGPGSVYWDIDNDGHREASGWITGGDGLLCAPGANNTVDGQPELFGNNATYANGYLMLDALYDSNNDNAITSADTNFGDLRVWVDANADGYSNSGELFTLSALGITSISTAYTNVNYTISGNAIKQESTFTMGGNSYASVDAWLTYDNVNTEYAGDYTLDVRTLFLPDLRGYGTIPDLHIAMSLDETLLDMVQEIASADPYEIFDSAFDLEGKFTDILYRWAGVEGISPTSRGSYVDAQKLTFMERFLDEPFIQTGNGNSSNPGLQVEWRLIDAWDNAYGSLLVRFLAQSGNLHFMPEGTVYNTITDELSGVLGDGPVNIKDQDGGYPDVSTSNDIYIYEAGDSLISSGGGDLINETLTGGVDWIVLNGINSANVVTWTDGQGRLYIQYTANDKIEVYATLTSEGSTVASYVERIVFDDTVWDLTQGLILQGSSANESFRGSALSDLITGYSGSDSIYGYGGDDTIEAGQGNDQISGGSGNDTFIFQVGDGTDTIAESLSGGTDTIILNGYAPEDVRMWTTSQGHLYIQNRTDSADQISINAGVVSGTTQSTIGQYVESIVFGDETVWDLNSGLILEINSGNLYGTAYGDTLTGTSGSNGIYGNGGNDTIIGKGGADQLYGGLGDDTFVFAVGEGTNTVLESLSQGTDVIDLTNYNPEDIRMWTDSFGHLHLQNENNASDHITVNAGKSGGTNQSTIGLYVERIVFDDSTVWELTGGLQLEIGLSGGNLYGTSYNDTLTGSSGSNGIYGNGGNDTLISKGGADQLYGGSGADIFLFEYASAFSAVSTIADFNLGQADKIDISDVLTLYDPLTHAITDFVQITTSGSNSSLFIDRDGTGSTYGLNQIATISGVTGLTDEAALVTSGNLVIV